MYTEGMIGTFDTELEGPIFIGIKPWAYSFGANHTVPVVYLARIATAALFFKLYGDINHVLAIDQPIIDCGPDGGCPVDLVNGQEVIQGNIPPGEDHGNIWDGQMDRPYDHQPDIGHSGQPIIGEGDHNRGWDQRQGGFDIEINRQTPGGSLHFESKLSQGNFCRADLGQPCAPSYELYPQISSLAEAITKLEQEIATTLGTSQCLGGQQACMDTAYHPSVFYQKGESYLNNYYNGGTSTIGPQEWLARAAASFLKADWLQKYGPEKFDFSQAEQVRQYYGLQNHLSEMPNLLPPNERQYFNSYVNNPNNIAPYGTV